MRAARRLEPAEMPRVSKAPGLHSDGGGLYLSVAAAPSNACSWVFRYMLKKRARTMGLGPYPGITLAEDAGDGIMPLDSGSDGSHVAKNFAGKTGGQAVIEPPGVSPAVVSAIVDE